MSGNAMELGAAANKHRFGSAAGIVKQLQLQWEIKQREEGEIQQTPTLPIELAALN